MVKIRMGDVDNVMHKNGQWLIDSGSPHLLVPVEDTDKIDVVAEGRKIRYNEVFAEHGINVNFIRMHEEGVQIRTYERGVENETLACGTGAVAAAIVAVSANSEIEPPVDVSAVGGSLRIYLNKAGEKFTNIWIEGPATCVFKGEMVI
jgi:diaminopimelate epimerase